MQRFFYVYVLVSEDNETIHYTGITQEQRWKRAIYYSRPTRFEPFTPELRPTIWIGASIIVKHANKCDPIFYVRSFPVPRPNTTQYIVVV